MPMPIAKILLISVNRKTIEDVRAALPEDRYEIVQADNEQTATELASGEAGESFSLALVDEKLFFLDGIGFVLFMRKVLRNKTLPALLMTSQADAGDLSDLYEAGVADFIRKPLDPEELKARIAGMGISRRYIDEITRQANFDELTALFNRRTFFRIVTKRFDEVMRYKLNMSLCMMDIDDFKLVNDRYGHTAGDMVLSSIGAVLAQNVRMSDVAGRYGGEEFAIYFPETAAKRAYIAAERIRRAVEALRFPFPGCESVTLSAGVTEFDASRHGSIEDLISEADRALYCSKRSGKNRITCFSGGETSC